MAALSEKALWPIVAIFIFAVLAGFYIDDRRRLMQQDDYSGKPPANSNEQAGEMAENKRHDKEYSEVMADEMADEIAEKSPAITSQRKQTSASASTSATSMSLNEYLSRSSSERSRELEANVAHHQGFSGSIDEYTGTPNAAKKALHADTDRPAGQSGQTSAATSMSMDEYRAKTGGHLSSSTQPADTSAYDGAYDGAYHGNIAGYLAKYGDGNQTAIRSSGEKPFNNKAQTGFHGSYEEYARKYK